MCECVCGLDCVWNGGVVYLSSRVEGALLPIHEQFDFLALCRVVGFWFFFLLPFEALSLVITHFTGGLCV